jgi:PmbA protein
LEQAAAGADAAEVFFSEAETTRVSFKAGELRETGLVHARALAVRRFEAGRVGFAATTDFERLDQLGEAARATARYGRRADYELPDGRDDYAAVRSYDDAVAALTPQEMVELGGQAVEILSAVDDRLVVAVEITRAVGRARLANSAGLDRAEETTAYQFVLVVQRAAAEDILFHYDRDASFCRDFDELDVARRLAADLRWINDLADVRTGKRDLIFAPAEVPTLLLPVVTCVSGAHVVDRSSALAERRGEEVVDERLTVIDDATEEFGLGAGSFDGEGTPCRRTAVIERGVLQTFLTDLATGSRLGTKSTGHARRGATSPPQPGISNVAVDPGERALDEIVADTKRGLLVLNTAGGAMSNLRGGELGATIGYGLKVEDGEIVGRVKDCLFAGNVFDMLGGQLREISRDRRRAGGHYLVPAIAIADQTVTAKG